MITFSCFSDKWVFLCHKVWFVVRFLLSFFSFSVCFAHTTHRQHSRWLIGNFEWAKEPSTFHWNSYQTMIILSFSFCVFCICFVSSCTALISVICNWRLSFFVVILISISLREKCPNMELFLVRIFLYSDWYRKIRTRNNFVFGHFPRSEYNLECLNGLICCLMS